MASFEELNDSTREQLAKTMFAILGDKDLSKEQKRLIAKKNPNYKDAELEIDSKMSEAIETLKKERDELKEERAKEKLTAQMEKIKGEIAEMGLDFEEVEKFAVANSFGDYKKAAEFMEKEKSQAEPTPPTLNVIKPSEEITKLIHNPGALRDARMAKGNEAITEILRGRRVG